MYNAKVYRVMIGAPSDIKEEIQMVHDAIYRWNALHSECSKIVLLPLHWSINSHPLAGNRPQEILNEQLVGKSDLLICVFGTRIGTPTGEAFSGTIEEINEHLKAGKDVMMFFKQTLDSISSLDPSQLQKLNEFKNSIKNKALLVDYQNTNVFESLLFDKLQLYINNHWLKEQQTEEKVLKPTIYSLTDFDKERLTKWSEGDREVWISDTADGRTIQIGESEYDIKDSKEEAEWDDFFDKMTEIGFAKIERYDMYGNPVYALTKKGYISIRRIF